MTNEDQGSDPRCDSDMPQIVRMVFTAPGWQMWSQIVNVKTNSVMLLSCVERNKKQLENKPLNDETRSVTFPLYTLITPGPVTVTGPILLVTPDNVPSPLWTSRHSGVPLSLGSGYKVV